LSSSGYSIADVASMTGISKETLRKWETRYAFPVPARDARGRRQFNLEQISRLHLIKRLLDRGLAPRLVVPRAAVELDVLLAGLEQVVPAADLPLDRDVVHAVKNRDPRAVRTLLALLLLQDGLARFVAETIPALNNIVGLAWADGRVAIHEEHMFTETLKAVIFEHLATIVPPINAPRILMTTPAGEAHTLGLMAAQAMLTIHGADCISLGSDLPFEEIVGAARQYDVAVVGLSFSDAFPTRQASAFLRELRQQLPASIALWAGGAGALRLTRSINGVLVLRTIEDAVAALPAIVQRKLRGVEDLER
jgi:methanogenic corrinoid protein MtbC1